MAHYKRKGPKSTRAGCMWCKPHKRQGAPLDARQKHGAARRMRIAREKMREAAGADGR